MDPMSSKSSDHSSTPQQHPSSAESTRSGPSRMNQPQKEVTAKNSHISNLVSSVINKTASQRGAPSLSSFSQASSPATAEVSDSLARMLSELSSFSLYISTGEGNFQVVEMMSQRERVVLLGKEEIAKMMMKFDDDRGGRSEGRERRVFVSNAHEIAGQESVVLNGEEYQVVVDDEVINQGVELFFEYQSMLAASAKKPKNESEKRALEQKMPVLPAARGSTALTVKENQKFLPSKLPTGIQQGQLEAARKKERVQEEREQAKDDEKVDSEKKIITEGLRKRENLKEGMEFQDRSPSE